MSVIDSFHISWQNDIDLATLASDVAAETEYPLTNMQNDNANKKTVFDMTGDNSVQITGSESTDKTATCFSVHNHNMPSDNTLRLRLYAAITQGGQVVYDSAGEPYFLFDGASGGFVHSPDSAPLSIVGDTEIRVIAALNDWTPSTTQVLAGKYMTAGDERSYLLFIDIGGLPKFTISTDGTVGTTENYVATELPAVADGEKLSIKVTIDVDDGASDSAVTFYTSTNYNAALDTGDWAQLGDVVNSGGVVSIHDGSALATVGAHNDDGVTSRLEGKIYKVQIYSGIGGTLVGDCDPKNWDAGASTLTSSATAEVWTVAGSASVVIDVDEVYDVIPWGSSIAGIDPWGSYFQDESNAKVNFSIWFDSVVYKSFTIDVDAPTSTNNQLSIDKLWLGYAWTPDFGVERGSSATLEDMSEHVFKPGGGMETIQREAVRILNLSFAGVSGEQRHTMRHILDKAKKGGDLMVSCDPNNARSAKYETTSIFRRTSNIDFISSFYNWNDTSIALREN